MSKEMLIPIKRELYETNPNVPGFVLASMILGPFYLSFEWALAFHGIYMLVCKRRGYWCDTFLEAVFSRAAE